MEETSNLKMPLLVQSQANKELVHNEALIIIDALLNNNVIIKGINTPPQNINNGDLYIIGSSPTDDFLDHAGELAFYFNGWHFIQPKAGLTLFVMAELKIYVYTGSSWISIEGGSGGGNGSSATPTATLPDNFNLSNEADNEIIKYDETTQKWINSNVLQNINKLGIGTSADDNNKLTVSSPYILLNNSGSSCQLKINKNSANDSSSLLFQSNWTGYAEFGLVGDNEFALKISSDGNNWFEVFKCDGATGKIFFKNDTETTGVLGDIKETVSSLNYDHGYWLKLNTTTRNVSRIQYSKLFAKIGTTYGTGDGSTTFGLPSYNVSGKCAFIFAGQW